MSARLRLTIACGVALLVGLTAAVLIMALGGNDGSAAGAPTGVGLAGLTRLEGQDPSPLITNAELAAAAGGPAATVLAWWRDMQFNAASGQVVNYYAATAGVSVAGLVAQRHVAGYYFAANKPVVVDASYGGDHARVFTLIGPGRLNSAAVAPGVTPFVFELARSSGRWLLSDNRFLISRVKAEAAFGATHH